MASFGSRGGLRQVVPLKKGQLSGTCVPLEVESYTQNTEPFIDLRVQIDNCEVEKKDHETKE